MVPDCPATLARNALLYRKGIWIPCPGLGDPRKRGGSRSGLPKPDSVPRESDPGRPGMI